LILYRVGKTEKITRADATHSEITIEVDKKMKRLELKL